MTPPSLGARMISIILPGYPGLRGSQYTCIYIDSHFSLNCVIRTFWRTWLAPPMQPRRIRDEVRNETEFLLERT